MGAHLHRTVPSCDEASRAGQGNRPMTPPLSARRATLGRLLTLHALEQARWHLRQARRLDGSACGRWALDHRAQARAYLDDAHALSARTGAHARDAVAELQQRRRATAWPPTGR